MNTTAMPDPVPRDPAGEKGYLNETKTTSSSQEGDVTYDGYDHSQLSFATRLGVTPESFKRRTGGDKHNQLNKTMKARHLNMIAIGGSIGAGLFVGSGGALSTGGPAALLIGFGIIGVVSVVFELEENFWLTVCR